MCIRDRLLPLALLVVGVARIEPVDERPAMRAKPPPARRGRAARADILEPREVAMDVGRREVEQDAQAPRVGGGEQAIERGLTAERGIDRGGIDGIVAMD